MKWHELVGASALGVLLQACHTPGTISTSPPAKAVELTSAYDPGRQLGQTPFSLPREDIDTVMRYRFETEDESKEYLMLLSPDELEGELKVPLVGRSASATLVTAYNEYFDQILRIHRLILRGQLNEAKRLVAKVNDEYDLTYGSLVLAGNIALLENKGSEAAEHYRMARALFPDEEVVKSIVP